MQFGFKSGYAESLEYGTGPLNDYQPTVDNGNYTFKSVYDALYEWAGKKDGKGSGLPIKDKKERAKFAKELTQRFFMYGMRQHPYWRPAVNWLLANQQRRFDEGYSLYEIADEALRIAKKALEDNNWIYNGELLESALIKEVEWSEIGNDGKKYRDYLDFERNKKFRKVGWM